MSVIIHGNIIDEVFDYEKLLQKATQRFKQKAEVSSKTIFDWFHELGWTQFIRYSILEKLMFKLRKDLWDLRELPTAESPWASCFCDQTRSPHTHSGGLGE